jgi:hypothetical protein
LQINTNMKNKKSIISVFVTSVIQKRTAKHLVNKISLLDSVRACNFDLEDCDKILRVESEFEISKTVTKLVNSKGFKCVELLD